ncbi:hypothetical protein [Cohnella sp. AR92]|uniref:hypothetical protein n=1 Tax=Cohnella sp. AR92 TaxID=648716 RepID=UPI000F8DACDF|nr:hypothetical protein [Cohnella sp. AR92]RUS46963.1 hypothetical protein ELR57_11185 [Cohnella sp. AR92]
MEFKHVTTDRSWIGLREPFEKHFPFIDPKRWTEIMNEFLASQAVADPDIVSLYYNNSYFGISKNTFENVLGTSQTPEWEEREEETGLMPVELDLTESD